MSISLGWICCRPIDMSPLGNKVINIHFCTLKSIILKNPVWLCVQYYGFQWSSTTRWCDICGQNGWRVVVIRFPDSKVHGAHMGPIWVLSAPNGPHGGPIKLAIWVAMTFRSMWVRLSTAFPVRLMPDGRLIKFLIAWLIKTLFYLLPSGVLINIKMSYQPKDFYYKDKTVSGPSYL